MATLPKGGDAKKMLENPDTKHILVCDTGQPIEPPESMRSPKTQEELNNVYRWTIQNGIVDHHSVDGSLIDIDPNLERKCATKMIADFPDEVLQLIEERGITQISAHFDSDFDSICSTYLAKSLLDNKKLPAFAKELSEQVNLVDYGKFDISDPEKFARSAAGIFSGLKNIILARQSAELGPLFGLPEDTDELKSEKGKKIGACFAKHGNMLLETFIQFLNACNKLYCERKGELNLTDIDVNELALEQDLRTLIQEGQEKEKKEYEKFDQEQKKAERSEVTVTTKEGKKIQVPVVIFEKPDANPLSIINKAYLIEDDNAIIAVFAGQDREHGGDCYDIGIKPDTAGRFDLKFLEAPLNQAEAELRAPIMAELEEKRSNGIITDEEKAKLQKWKTPRQGFEYLQQGDPSVCVAGGSLIAASTTSLLSAEQFRDVLEEVGIIKAD
ncbi:hypothetical protein GF391_02145 [Candidatus Uhrbacteria bacterium]|nr:hypothetical protein [Candidatus Uhrbacteria bacterium]